LPAPILRAHPGNCGLEMARLQALRMGGEGLEPPASCL
jgi:hypothetical protein